MLGSDKALVTPGVFLPLLFNTRALKAHELSTRCTPPKKHFSYTGTLLVGKCTFKLSEVLLNSNSKKKPNVPVLLRIKHALIKSKAVLATKYTFLIFNQTDLHRRPKCASLRNWCSFSDLRSANFKHFLGKHPPRIPHAFSAHSTKNLMLLKEHPQTQPNLTCSFKIKKQSK